MTSGRPHDDWQSNASTMDTTFDAIVIGSGIGELMSGALRAKAELQVPMVECNHGFGDAARIFNHSLDLDRDLGNIDGATSPRCAVQFRVVT